MHLFQAKPALRLYFPRISFKVMEPENAESYLSVTYINDKASLEAWMIALVPNA
jgi:hypothetical protein